MRFAWSNSQLRRASPRDELLEVLDYIRVNLSSNRLPYLRDMTIFELRVDSASYQTLSVPSEAFRAYLQTRDAGASLRDSWPVVEVAIMQRESPDLPKNERLGDVSWISAGMPAFSPRAVSALRVHLEEAGELLPLTSSVAPGWMALNVRRVVDALDASGSRLIRFKSGKVLDVAEFAFIPERLRGGVFIIPELGDSRIFADQAVVDQARGADLRGFDLRAVWSLAVH